MEVENINWGIISAFVVVTVIFFTIGGVFLYADLTGDDDEDLYREIDTGRGEYDANDLSIFRGLSMDQVYERTRQAIGSPELEKRTVIYDHSFEKEIHYEFPNRKYIMLQTEFHDGKPYDHFISATLNRPEDGEMIYDTTYALNETETFFRGFLGYFDTALGDNFITEVQGMFPRSNGIRIILRQTLQGNLFANDGMMAEVDLHTGNVSHIWINDWLFIEEVEDPRYDWDHGSREIIGSLERLNFTTEILLTAEPLPDHSLGWSEFVRHEVDASWIDHKGYSAVMGRYCCVLSIEYWTTGNFSNSYRDPEDWETEREVWVNGTIVTTQNWFFDTVTGKLLLWELSGERSSTGQDLPENLGSSNTTWDERFLVLHPGC